jgi:hypothetical protein
VKSLRERRRGLRCPKKFLPCCFLPWVNHPVLPK